LAAWLLFFIALLMQPREPAMTHTESATQNPINKSLVPMFLVWSRAISWTIILSALVAVLFALLCDGCSGHH
jgi:hypothetical protein